MARSLVRLALIGATMVLVSTAGAVTFTVDSTTDASDTSPGDGICLATTGGCSLRAAVEEANALPGADGISLASGTHVLTASPSDLVVSDALTIDGAGAASTIVDAAGGGRILAATAPLSLSRVTVRNGSTTSFGGGLLGAPAAHVTVTDCVFTGNSALGGGALFAVDFDVVRTTFTGNGAAAGGAIGTLGSPAGSIDGRIRESTFASNTAPSGGDALFLEGPGTLAVTNSTIDGALDVYASCDSPFLPPFCEPTPDITLANVTLAALTFRPSGGPDANVVAVTARNSIVLSCTWIEGTTVVPMPFLVSQGYNFVDPSACKVTGDVTGNVGGDPLLGPLAHNGGPTSTRLPGAGSPVIGAGNPSPPGSGGLACEADDQRGVARPVGSRCDIGAVEASCPATPCDDGNPCTDDSCGPGGDCVHAANTLPCDDGDPCTAGDLCSGGSCGGVSVVCDPCYECLPSGACGIPPATCEAAPVRGARLGLTRRGTGSGDRVTFRWKSAGSVAPSGFGDPTSGDDAILCVYDAAGAVALSAVAPAGGTCGTRPCWTATAKGFRYRDPARTPDGLDALTIVSGSTGRIRARGSGSLLGLADLPLVTPVRARLYREGHARCWGAVFSSHVSIDTPTRLRATSD